MRKPTKGEVVQKISQAFCTVRNSHKEMDCAIVEDAADAVMALFEDDHDPIPAKVGICEECGKPYEDRPKSANLNEHWDLTCPCGWKSEVDAGTNWVVCGCGRRIEFGGARDKPIKWEEDYKALKTSMRFSASLSDPMPDFIRSKLREMEGDVRRYNRTSDQIREKWGL